MAWFTSLLLTRWRWLTLNLAALGALVYVLVYVLVRGGTNWWETDGFDPMLESGKWGIRFLLICLTMTPLHTYLRWSSTLKLRKSAGLWAFAFGAIHLSLYAFETWQPSRVHQVNGTPWAWLTWPWQLHIAFGLLALSILTMLALTSNKWAMRRLGKNWKRLHRWVYAAGVAILVHALLASTVSKKMMVRDPQGVTEAWIYLGVLAILLVIRIPQVRSNLFKQGAVTRPQRRSAAPIT